MGCAGDFNTKIDIHLKKNRVSVSYTQNSTDRFVKLGDKAANDETVSGSTLLVVAFCYRFFHLIHGISIGSVL